MSRVSWFFLSLLALVFFLSGEVLYLKNSKTLKKSDIDKRGIFLSLSSLPDLSVSTETRFIRHRSLSDVFSIFSESPETREYFPATFVYSPSKVLSLTPSKVVIGD